MRRLAVCLVLLTALLGQAEAGLEDSVRQQVKDCIISRDAGLKDSRIEIELKSSGVLERYKKRTGGGFSVKLDYPVNQKLSGSAVLPVKIYEKGKYKETVYLQSRIKIMKNVLAVSDKIRKGEVFTSLNTDYVERDISHLPAGIVFDRARVEGKESVTLMPKGTLVLEWMARKIPDVVKGREITVFSVRGDILAGASCTALEDGYIGQKIRFKNTPSNKVIEAYITGPSEAQIR
ncbi:MAG: flagellar basal body P-ring formation chaperone FlgA [Candidatus Margulisiibacteriota bacterium]